MSPRNVACYRVGLLLLRQHLVWWPLSPMDVSFQPVIHKGFCTVLLAWFLKITILPITILCYGGPELFGRLCSFFLGLMFGYFCPLAFLLLVDRIAECLRYLISLSEKSLSLWKVERYIKLAESVSAGLVREGFALMTYTPCVR